MSPAPATPLPPSSPLRLWPGVAIVAVQWLARFVVPSFVPDATPVGVMAGVAGGVAILVWWVFFSRAPWAERLGVVALMAGALFASYRIVHPSIATGMMGFMLPVYAVPTLSLALVAGAAATRRSSPGVRRWSLVAAILLASGVWTLVRTGGFSSDLQHDWAWRWAPTPEDRLLAGVRGQPVAPKGTPPAVATPSAAPAPAAPEWPGFRGAGRDSILRGVRLETNWTASPPVELWRKPVGPGWSSFAVSGGRIYTQEQRGEVEVVACYTLAGGEPVWLHRDQTRFWESNAGPGPRATPSLHAGRAYTLGATGVLNALDAATGAVAWTRNAAADTKTKTPDWGFSGSPLIVDDVVIVAIDGTLAAYDQATGAPRWVGPTDDKSYSSPHLFEIAGTRQVVLMSGAGATSVTPADGKVLWQHPWKGFGIVQPAQISPGQLVISTGDRLGARRIEVASSRDAWTVTERWTSLRLKPYFNDFVLHGGHAYGFDGGALACVDLAEGERKWKGGRYGSGQLVLLADQDILLVLSEQGELALVRAAPGEFTELARFKALEGKTWNHPVLAGHTLLVRNDREMAAFRLR